MLIDNTHNLSLRGATLKKKEAISNYQIPMKEYIGRLGEPSFWSFTEASLLICYETSNILGALQEVSTQLATLLFSNSVKILTFWP